MMMPGAPFRQMPQAEPQLVAPPAAVPAEAASSARTAGESEWERVPDETTGHTYYWNKNTNAVQWTAPAGFAEPPAQAAAAAQGTVALQQEGASGTCASAGGA